jgi:hypothetical protein
MHPSPVETIIPVLGGTNVLFLSLWDPKISALARLRSGRLYLFTTLGDQYDLYFSSGYSYDWCSNNLHTVNIVLCLNTATNTDQCVCLPRSINLSCQYGVSSIALLTLQGQMVNLCNVPNSNDSIHKCLQASMPDLHWSHALHAAANPPPWLRWVT